MIEYGIMCLAVLLLTGWDRQAMPYAFVLLASWIAGFGGPDIWAAISLLSGLIFLSLTALNPTRWGYAVSALSGLMLVADVLYQLQLTQGVYIGVEYAYTLNVCLLAQLLLVGHRGVLNGWTSIRRGLLGRLHSSRVLSGARESEG